MDSGSKVYPVYPRSRVQNEQYSRAFQVQNLKKKYPNFSGNSGSKVLPGLPVNLGYHFIGENQISRAEIIFLYVIVILLLMFTLVALRYVNLDKFF